LPTCHKRVGGGADADDSDVLESSLPLQLPRDVTAIEVRQPEIEQYDFRPGRPGDLDDCVWYRR
jgi:hypothetical protein